MFCVVAPVDQVHEVPLLAMSVTESPAQNVVGPFGVIAATGTVMVTTVIVAVSEHPFALVTVTE